MNGSKTVSGNQKNLKQMKVKKSIKTDSAKAVLRRMFIVISVYIKGKKDLK